MISIVLMLLWVRNSWRAQLGSSSLIHVTSPHQGGGSVFEMGPSVTCLVPPCSLTSCLSAPSVSSRTSSRGLGFSQHGALKAAALVGWWLTSLNKWPKRQEVDAVSFLRPGPRNWHNIASAIFYWSQSSHWALPDSGAGTQTLPLTRRSIKEFINIFNVPQSVLENGYYIPCCRAVRLWFSIFQKFVDRGWKFTLKILNLLIFKYWQLIQIFWKTCARQTRTFANAAHTHLPSNTN